MPIRKPVFRQLTPTVAVQERSKSNKPDLRGGPRTEPVGVQFRSGPSSRPSTEALPSKPMSKKGTTSQRNITLQQLFKLQISETKEKAKLIVVKTSTNVKKGGGGIVAKVLNYDPFEPPPNPSVHICSITGLNPDLTVVQPVGLKLNCNCERFKFVHDYALHYHGLSSLEHSINRPPRTTNPQFRGIDGFQICKHLYGLIYSLLIGKVKIRKAKGEV
jgi:hypothetical protein